MLGIAGSKDETASFKVETLTYRFLTHILKLFLFNLMISARIFNQDLDRTIVLRQLSSESQMI